MKNLLKSLQETDRQLFLFLNNLGIEEYDHFWILVTQKITWIPLYVLMAILVIIGFFPGWKKILGSFLTLGLSLGFTVLFTRFIKNLIGRLRPNQFPGFESEIRILQNPETFSFFSAHASTSFVVTTVMVLLMKKRFPWIYLLFIWPILFSWSRIYVGVHYPSDILVGAAVGSLIGIISYRFYRVIVVQVNKRY